MFPNIRNVLEILKFRFLGKNKILYFFHEPVGSYLDFYNSGFTILQLFKLLFINFVNIATISLCSHVILPSQNALSIYKNKYRFYNKKYSLIHLFFKDENIISLNDNNKKYISYIGTIASDHAFNKFCNFIDYALQNVLFKNFIFLIATGSILPDEAKNKFDKYKSNKQLLIFNGSWLSNDEINNFYCKSVLIWNAYDRSTQSGVLPKAFMFSTPVLGNDLSKNEYIIQNYNGIYLKDNSDLTEISNSIQIIIDNIEFYSRNSRDTFLTKFYYKNYISEFKNILKNE
jgi:hypothetical protein